MKERDSRIIGERYRLDRTIGQGGMGSVFEAFDLRLERPVAVKIIHGHVLREEQARARFLREARVAAKIQSPHVVAIYDVGAEDHEIYLVQELLSGTDLGVILRREGKLDPRRAVDLAVQVCKALSAIHGMGVMHRDIKPSNLFLTAASGGSERLVLVDFGLAKLLEEQGRDAITQTGRVMGTPTYMAPEQAQSDYAIDERADLFSLGAVLFELLTGEPPFVGNNIMATLAKILLEDPPLIPADRASPELQAVVQRCLVKTRGDRYPSAAALMEALHETPEGREGYVPPRELLPSAAPASDTDPSPPQAAQATIVAFPPPTKASLSAADAPKKAFSSKPSPELSQYLDQAGLALQDGPGPLFSIERRPDCRLLPMRLWAILLEPEDQPLSAETMATMAFQRDARPLYALSGTAESPHHVLALFRSPPGAGVYREWNELAARRHVHVSPVSPSALRAAVDANRAAAHLQDLLRRARRDPFEHEGRIVTDLDFFGGREDLQAFLRLIDGSSPGIGLFGLEKWGTTSLLYRARAELSDRISAWIDLAALPSLSLTSVLSAIHVDLANALLKRAPPPLSPLHGDVEAEVHRIAAACHAVSGARPVIFLDRVDELSSQERCAPEALIAIARALYRLAFPHGDQQGSVLIFGGREAHLLSSRSLCAQDNPLWGAIAVRYASFFSREEMGDFMQRLGALGGLCFTPAALDKAFELTFGHKYLSRRLGSLLYQRGPLGREGSFEVTPEGVSACAVPLITRHNPYFDAVLRRGPPRIRDVLALLSQGPSGIEELFASEAVRASGDPFTALDFASAYGLAVEEQGRYRLTMGLLEAWLRWTHDPKRAPARAAPPGPPLPPHPSASEVAELEQLIREGFSSPSDLELLARQMHVPLATVVRSSTPLPNQIGDLVDWAVKHRRFGDLFEAVKRERPAFFKGGVGQTLIMKAGRSS